ncbi:lysine-rich arabinogalactan protein 19-like [Solenopsis invicta]|uniref:lysine-rich arabinogalactan protein 19-like n=1 Tax=Solenopsis invicta TaxID=13686 RepID=UPI0005962694|nr:lysine-rich arabinogalactan protein 19-like [Solenopsis invicta]
MEQLDALLIEPANDEEFEALWSQVMTMAPQRSDLFPTTSTAAPLLAAGSDRKTSLPGGGLPTTGLRRTRGINMRIPPCTSRALIEEARKTGPRQCFVRAASAPKRDAPVIGVRVQRSSATNARKLAALIAEPPLPSKAPRRPIRPTEKTARASVNLPPPTVAPAAPTTATIHRTPSQRPTTPKVPPRVPRPTGH